MHEQMEDRGTEKSKREFRRGQRERKSSRHGADSRSDLFDSDEQRQLEQRRHKSKCTKYFVLPRWRPLPKITVFRFFFQLENKKKKLEESVKKSYSEYYTYCVRTARAKWERLMRLLFFFKTIGRPVRWQSV